MNTQLQSACRPAQGSRAWLLQLPGTLALVLVLAAGLTLVGLGILLIDTSADSPVIVSGSILSSVEGVVVDADGPVAGATVRVRATDNVTYTAADGAFTLTGVATGIALPVTAWFDGYYITQTEVVAPVTGVTLTLALYSSTDNPDYPWIFPHRADSPPDVDYGCDTCHADIIVAQWETNAHALAARDPRFLSLYNGTDITGTQVIPPGYVLDFPDTAGNCATCHAPAAAMDAPYTTSMSDLTAPESDGVFCDFCHKTGGVYLNPATGLPYSNAPGVLSLDLRRPPEGQQMFFGPYTDVPEPDTYLPIMQQSQFCAPCHSFSFWGTPIYQSFNEWQASPYPAKGVHCQTCHMSPDPNVDHFVAPENGGYIRDPMTIPSHKQPGAANVTLLQNTVDMTLTARQMGSGIQVTVVITNTGAGHDVPTDHPGRHLILTVLATDGQGQALPLQDGAVVPEWGGAQAGLPGKAFAKVLRDVQTSESPVVSYWKQTLIEGDNRIPAMGSDTSTYRFQTPAPDGQVTVRAELRFRRAFQAVMDAKGWDTPDIVMEETQSTVRVQPWWKAFLPLIGRSALRASWGWTIGPRRAGDAAKQRLTQPGGVGVSSQ